MSRALVRSSGWILGACFALIAAVGCRKKTEVTPLKLQTAKAPGVLIGSVRLEPGRELPSYPADQMERQVLMHVKGGTFPDVCSPAKIADRMPVRLSDDGKLIGVMAAASDFAHQPPAPKVGSLRDVEIKDCRLTPNLVVARVGDVLRVKNEVNYPLFPGLVSDTFNQTLSLGQSRDIPLDTGGVKILECGFTAPCGRTDIVVLSHPYFAVTDEKGEFRIEDFPVDETLRVNVWHPLFIDAGVQVRVAAGETKRIEFVLTPVPPPTPKPTPPKGTVVPD